MEQQALHVDVHHEDGSYWAEVRELPGCFAAGDTIAELIESVEEGVALYLASPERSGAGQAGRGVSRRVAALEVTWPSRRADPWASDSSYEQQRYVGCSRAQMGLRADLS